MLLIAMFSFHPDLPAGVAAALRGVPLFPLPGLQVQVCPGLSVHGETEAQCGPDCGHAL